MRTLSRGRMSGLRRQRLGDYAARTVVQERQLDLGGRITVVLIWIIVVAASIWATHAINPAWFSWTGW